MKIARLLITMKCQRNCDGCCNKYKSLMDKAIHIKDLRPLDSFKIICVTGGEPMLNWDRTMHIIGDLNSIKRTIYLYTAQYHPNMEDTLYYVNGVHYTLHYPLTMSDLNGFYKFQELLLTYNFNDSYRLYIDNRIPTPINIIPEAWTRVEIKPWMKEGDCPFPKDETLFILDEDYK